MSGMDIHTVYNAEGAIFMYISIIRVSRLKSSLEKNDFNVSIGLLSRCQGRIFAFSYRELLTSFSLLV